MDSKTKISISSWSKSEESYAEEREELLSKVSSKEVANAPFVYSDRQSITSSLTRIDLFRKVLNNQGSIVECGVHKGNSLFL